MGKLIKKSKSIGQSPGTLIYKGKIRPDEVKITILEGILNINQRPKMEGLGAYIYIAAKMLAYEDKTSEISEEQVSILFGSNFFRILHTFSSTDCNFFSIRGDFLSLRSSMVTESYFVFLSTIGVIVRSSLLSEETAFTGIT